MGVLGRHGGAGYQGVRPGAPLVCRARSCRPSRGCPRMSQRPASRTPRPTVLRLCAAAAAARLGATALLGAGTALAAEKAPARAGAAASIAAQADAQAKPATQAKKRAAAWVDPVDAYRLSATFGTGGSMWAHKHSGQDFAVPVG